MRGDILLYRSGGSLKDRVVCWYTRGPYCHCEIDLGDGTSVGAHSEDGISRRSWAIVDRIVAVSLHERTTPERIEVGIAWVMGHVGEPFSWASIAAHVLPRWLAFRLFGRQCVYDCANLVAGYLAIVDGRTLPPGRTGAVIVSPNDIAEALNRTAS